LFNIIILIKIIYYLPSFHQVL